MKLSLSIYGYKQPGDTLLNQAGFLTSALSFANYVLLKLVHLQCFTGWSPYFLTVCQSSDINSSFSCVLLNFSVFVNVFGSCSVRKIAGSTQAWSWNNN